MFLSYCRPQIRPALNSTHHSHQCYPQGLFIFVVLTSVVLMLHRFNSSTLYAHLKKDSTKFYGGPSASKMRLERFVSSYFPYSCADTTSVYQQVRVRSSGALQHAAATWGARTTPRRMCRGHKSPADHVSGGTFS